MIQISFDFMIERENLIFQSYLKFDIKRIKDNDYYISSLKFRIDTTIITNILIHEFSYLLLKMIFRSIPLE